LFEELGARSEGHALAWDCGTGNGQAAHGLIEHFDAVLATDPSAAQLAQAPVHPRITFRLAPEAASGLPPHSVDLVTAAQAAHWFDRNEFYKEVGRVLRPGGLVAIWCYALCRISPEIDRLMDDFYHETVGPYWPQERRHTADGYRSLDFPFDELPFPSLSMEHDWTLGHFGSYLRTWSAVARYSAARNLDPVVPLLKELAPFWGDPGRVRRVVWPLAGRMGRVREIGGLKIDD